MLIWRSSWLLGQVKEMWLRAVQTKLRLLKLSREPPPTLSSTLLDDREEQIPRICWIQTFPIDSTRWPANSHIRMTRQLGNQQETKTAYTVHVDPGPERWTGKAGPLHKWRRWNLTPPSRTLTSTGDVQQDGSAQAGIPFTVRSQVCRS